MTAQPIAAGPVQAAHFRHVLGHHPTGVCVVTACDPHGTPMGMTVGSFTSVSLDPPLVAFFPTRGSRVYAIIAESGHFAVNFLAGDQVEVCRRFATGGEDKFRGQAWRPSPLGSPVLNDAPAWIDCVVERIVEVGDHLMVVGSVDQLDVERSTAPLLFFQGGYGRFSTLSMVADSDDAVGVHLKLAELARPMLEDISTQFAVHVAASALIDGRIIQLAWAGADEADLRTNYVGLRLPFAAPFGLVFAAWDRAEVIERWLSRCDSSAPDGERVREVLLDEIEQTRQRGWAVIPDHPSLREVEASIARMAAQGPLPGVARDLAAQIDRYVQAFAILSEQHPRGLSVPVFGERGQVALALTAQRLPDLGPTRIEACRQALLGAAERLSVSMQLATSGG